VAVATPAGRPQRSLTRPRAAIEARGYRPEIDGLRALAVVAVVAYHAGLPGFGGGFVGVDVFFVISGFLITGLLAREVEGSGRLSVAGFYGRRARRLLPMSALVTIVTVAVGWRVLSPLLHRDLVADAFATSTYTINIRLAGQQLDYLRSTLAPSAFQQFWSLAVEEQFYLLWPLLMVVVLRGSLPRRRAAICVSAVCLASLAASVLLTQSQPPWAFFLLGTRAWQLGLGGLLALGLSRVETQVDARLRMIGQVAGLGLIVVSVVAFGETMPWPGSWALVPTVGTVLVLAGPSAVAGRGSRVSRALSAGPAVWVGQRSYSWHLWHWPAMVFAAAAADRGIGGWTAVVAGVGTLGLAHVTYRMVEQPVRRAPRLVASPRRSVLFGVTVTLSLACLFAVLGHNVGDVVGSGQAARDVAARALNERRLDRAALVQAVPSNLTPKLSDAYDDLPAVYAAGCHLSLEQVTPLVCRYGDVEAERTVVLFGDSHAAQWVPALDALGVRQGFALVPLTKSGCPAADLSVYDGQLRRVYTECADWRAAAIARIAELHPDLTVVANSSEYVGVGEQAPDDDTWVSAFERTLAGVARSGPVVLLADTPRPISRVNECLSVNLATADRCVLVRREAVDTRFERIETRASEASDVPLVPTVDLICGRRRCPVMVGSALVYRDSSHLTTVYAERLARTLGARLREAQPEVTALQAEG